MAVHAAPVGLDVAAMRASWQSCARDRVGGMKMFVMYAKVPIVGRMMVEPARNA